MDKTGFCVKETGNWSKLVKEEKFDNENFSKDIVKNNIAIKSPKLEKLLEKIKELDKQDIEKTGKMYKHFIYSDIKSGYGAKLIASLLYQDGYEHAYSLEKTSKGLSFKIKNNLEKFKNNVFATLTSVLFFEKPIGIKFRKELLGMYNNRPDNIYGEKIRIIILDSGFREGIDLFDVKYVHLIEPLLTKADEKQAIGRATRFCGQKGLHFEKNIGWPIYVYKYDTVLSQNLKNRIEEYIPKLIPSESFFDIFFKYSNIDPKKITLANELEPLIINTAVDKYLTRHIHNFEIEKLDNYKNYQEIFRGGDLNKYQQTQKYIHENFKKFSWKPTKIENGCLDLVKIDNNDNNKVKLVNFSPTQNFLRHYFTPENPIKGILLNHSVGTGKTCSAIAIASSSFQQEGYTIIYVTRHTLKGDVWKNMFGQTCNVIIQNMIKDGINIPEAETHRKKLINSWMEPMSYKQFSNMLEGKNQLYDDLIKRNGTDDPLKKTLIIIDEAHKLYAPDVVGTEKPDINSIKKALLNSYSKSGKNSAKVVIMTATPYTDDPMDIIKLLNLLRKEKEQLPEIFETFAEKYLDQNGKFTIKGKYTIMNELAGYISYLNREKDVRSFSYPVIENINVQLSNYEFNNLLENYSKKYKTIKNLKDNINLLKKDLHRSKIDLKRKLTENYNKEINEKEKRINECKKNKDNDEKNELIEEAKINKKINNQECNEIKKKCIEEQKEYYKNNIDNLKDNSKEEIEKCKIKIQECKNKLKENNKILIEDLKEQNKIDIKNCGKNKECKEDLKLNLKKQINEEKSKLKLDIQEQCNIKLCKQNIRNKTKLVKNELKEDIKFDKNECSERVDYKLCVEKVEEQYKKDIKEIKDNDPCEILKKRLIEYKNIQKEIIKNKINNQQTKAKKIIEFDEERLTNYNKEVKDIVKNIKNEVKKDNSQQLKLEECLNITPEYKDILNNKLDYIAENNTYNTNNTNNAENVNIENNKANIYLIHGHGKEKVKNFNQRNKIPNDKILVVFPVCGRPNWLNIACNFTDLFNNKEYFKYLVDPIKYKNDIEKIINAEIRIYLPGDSVPELYSTLFYEFEKEEGIVLMKSGVYSYGNIPEINRERLIDNKISNLGSESCLKYTGQIKNEKNYNNKVHFEVYKSNIYEPLKLKKTYEEMRNSEYSINDVMNTIGSGIYYYTGCRTSSQNFSNSFYENILNQSAKQQEKKDRKDKNKQFKKEYIKIEDKDLSVSFNNSNNSSSNSSNNNSASSINIENNDKNTREKISDKIFKDIQNEIYSYVDKFSELTEKDKENIQEKIKIYKNIIEEREYYFEASKERILKLVNSFENLFKTNNTFVIKIKKYKLNKEYISLYKIKEYNDLDKNKFIIKVKFIGILPLDYKSVKNKCTDKMILKRIKILDKNDRLDELNIPKTLEEWKEKEKIFNEVCKQTKNLVIN